MVLRKLLVQKMEQNRCGPVDTVANSLKFMEIQCGSVLTVAWSHELRHRNMLIPAFE